MLNLLQGTKPFIHSTIMYGSCDLLLTAIWQSRYMPHYNMDVCLLISADMCWCMRYTNNLVAFEGPTLNWFYPNVKNLIFNQNQSNNKYDISGKQSFEFVQYFYSTSLKVGPVGPLLASWSKIVLCLRINSTL